MAMTASVPGFDAPAYARRLKEAGVDEAQAEAHAEAVRDAITKGVATKADIVRIETRPAELKVTMLPAMVALAGVIVALVKLLP